MTLEERLELRKFLHVKLFKHDEEKLPLTINPKGITRGGVYGRIAGSIMWQDPEDECACDVVRAYEATPDGAFSVIKAIRAKGFGYRISEPWTYSSAGRGVTVGFFRGVYIPEPYQGGYWANVWDQEDMNFSLAVALAAQKIVEDNEEIFSY